MALPSLKVKPDSSSISLFESVLPSGWSVHWSNSKNHVYFFNKVTNESRYDLPSTSNTTIPVKEPSKEPVKITSNETVKETVKNVTKDDASNKPVKEVNKETKEEIKKNVHRLEEEAPTSIKKVARMNSRVIPKVALSTSLLISKHYDFTTHLDVKVEQGKISTAEKSNVSPFVEWSRWNVIRSLREYYNEESLKWLRRPAVKESFNRWIYLQLATPNCVLKSFAEQSEVDRALTTSFNNFLDIDAITPSLDPIIRFPAAGCRSLVLKNELRAEIPMRCDKSDFSSWKTFKIKNALTNYCKKLCELLTEWLKIPAKTFYSDSNSSSWLTDAIDEAAMMILSVHREWKKIDSSYVYPPVQHSLLGDLLKEAMFALRESSNFNSNSGSDLNRQLVILRDSCAPLLDMLFLPRIDMVCFLLENKSIAELSKFSTWSASLNPSFGNVSVITLDESVDIRLNSSINDLQSNFGSSTENEIRFKILDNILTSNTVQGSSNVVVDSLSISTLHFEKLTTLLKLHSNHITEDAYPLFLYILLRRYSTLLESLETVLFIPRLESEEISASNVTVREGAGFHAAAPEGVFKALKHYGAAAEVYASPLNCYFAHFCSAFPDIDCYFGSLGSFFDFRPTSGFYECNPPFTVEVMDATALFIDSLLEATNEPLSFAVMVPNWNDPPAAYIQSFGESRYCQMRFVLTAREHQYIIGSQQSSMDSRYFDSIHDTLFYILQNESGKKKWPPNETLRGEIIKGFNR